MKGLRERLVRFLIYITIIDVLKQCHMQSNDYQNNECSCRQPQSALDNWWVGEDEKRSNDG